MNFFSESLMNRYHLPSTPFVLVLKLSLIFECLKSVGQSYILFDPTRSLKKAIILSAFIFLMPEYYISWVFARETRKFFCRKQLFWPIAMEIDRFIRSFSMSASPMVASLNFLRSSKLTKSLLHSAKSSFYGFPSIQSLLHAYMDNETFVSNSSQFLEIE